MWIDSPRGSFRIPAFTLVICQYLYGFFFLFSITSNMIFLLLTTAITIPKKQQVYILIRAILNTVFSILLFKVNVKARLVLRTYFILLTSLCLPVVVSVLYVCLHECHMFKFVTRVLCLHDVTYKGL